MKQLNQILAEKYQMNDPELSKAREVIAGYISEELQKGEVVCIDGFGEFQTKEVAGRKIVSFIAAPNESIDE